jgi:DNA-binding response OmpR family regulator
MRFGVSMPVTIVLAVGFDPWSFEAQRTAWRSAGFFVTAVRSAREALDPFQAGDFDLVLLHHSVPVENSEKLIFLLRAAGSQVPVVTIPSSSGKSDTSAYSIDLNESDALVRRVAELLPVPTKKLPPRPVGKSTHGMLIDWPQIA